ncbi:MAG: ChbG/HpnK family deacetylase [Tepidisphaeraceae bacterium]|jgi:predicted glycoside hydrolase/deacetylase ChbG (UPF0249 family)
MTNDQQLAIVVTADDFGIGRRTSEGILQAHLQGPVTATSLMVVTGDHVRASLPLLAEAPNLDVGLHLVLTRCGHAPLVARKSSGLCDDDGFVTNGRLWIRSMTARLDRNAVTDEIAAQAQLFHKLVGRLPTHVDAHHHAHQLPVIRGALLEVMARGLLPAVTRVTVEPGAMMRFAPGVRARRCAAHLLGKRAAKLFWRRGVWANDFYFGMLDSASLRRDAPWRHFLQRLPDFGVVEWVVHPGLPDETLRGRDSYSVQRWAELRSLIDPAHALQWQRLRPLLTRKSVLAPGRPASIKN